MLFMDAITLGVCVLTRSKKRLFFVRTVLFDTVTVRLELYTRSSVPLVLEFLF